jgi:centromere/kinetochore protein ZW10
MTTTAYYTSLGTIINDTLRRVLREVLGLRDIPEVESQRLAALCRILHPLDELFVESADKVLVCHFVESTYSGLFQVSSVAVYVPLWLKFTYLSDILVRNFQSFRATATATEN